MEQQRKAATSDAATQFREHVVPELDVLLRVAQRMTGRTADAEDLVQETLIRAYRAVDRFDGRYPRAWLLTILRNTWKNMNRRARLPMVNDEHALANAPGLGADGRNAPEEFVMDSTLGVELTEGLQKLPGTFRQVVLLVDVDGLTYEETAGVLGIPAGTVMSRLHRARRRLRKHLEQAGITPNGTVR
ncbi:MAG: sigma-70 family RNA polymerase sigma factor [Egibacteraceae bacterium]